jgi:ankyrin repeat protein
LENKELDCPQKAKHLSGADPDSRSPEGVSALGLALRNDAQGMVKLLIDRGASVNVAAEDEVSPLALAIKLNQPQAVRLLRNAGAIASESIPESR